MTKKKDPKDYKKIGRPTSYNSKIGKEICDAIACSELGLVHLVEQNPHWPVRSTIFLWMRTHPDFSNMYAKAKEDQTEVCVEYMQELMNEPHKIVDEETGYTRIDVGMLRLKVDAIKWQTAKLKPRKYGDVKSEETSNDLHEDVIKRKNDLDEKNKKEF